MNAKNINLDSSGLEDLLKQMLGELYGDVDEADANIQLYKDEILKVAGKQMYGEHLNNAMRLKGDARDRLIKLVNIIKDRVKSKEVIDKINTPNGENSEENFREIAKQVAKEIKNES